MSTKPSKQEQDRSGDALHLNKLLSAAPAPAHPSGQSGISPALPASDLEEGVTEMVRRAVSETLEAPGARAVLPFQAEQLSPKAVLALISYCYAKGIYSSREIEDQLLKDPEARASMGPEIPDDRSLSRFRRLNRQLIEDTLQRVITDAKHQHDASTAEKAPAVGEEQPTAIVARQAAQDLVQRAMFIDGMTRDY